MFKLANGYSLTQLLHNVFWEALRNTRETGLFVSSTFMGELGVGLGVSPFRDPKKLGSNLCHSKSPGGSEASRQVPIPPLAPGHIFVSAGFLPLLKIKLHLEKCRNIYD